MIQSDLFVPDRWRSLNHLKGHLTITKRSPAELPGFAIFTYIWLRFMVHVGKWITSLEVTKRSPAELPGRDWNPGIFNTRNSPTDSQRSDIVTEFRDDPIGSPGLPYQGYR